MNSKYARKDDLKIMHIVQVLNSASLLELIFNGIRQRNQTGLNSRWYEEIVSEKNSHFRGQSLFTKII